MRFICVATRSQAVVFVVRRYEKLLRFAVSLELEARTQYTIIDIKLMIFSYNILRET